jgi:hypothetical protein
MWKYYLAWVPMVLIAIVNGLLREKVIALHFNALQSHQISTVTFVILLGIYIWVIIRFWTPVSSGQAIAVGLMWVGLTVVFEFLFGHYVMGHPWSRLFHDYNFLAGRVWILIPIWVALAPTVFYRLRK